MNDLASTSRAKKRTEKIILSAVANHSEVTVESEIHKQ